MKMWKNNAPGPSKQHAPASPPIQGDDEIPNMPDITLEDDLLGLEDDLANARGPQPDNQPENERHVDRPGHLHVTVKNAENGDQESEYIYYVEQFPAGLGAGAVWGEDVPFFERLWREQQENTLSRWGPFEDQDEWELAKWLVRNVGQKQLNTFLTLDIVRSRCFEG
jgi:hypothetical protein